MILRGVLRLFVSARVLERWEVNDSGKHDYVLVSALVSREQDLTH